MKLLALTISVLFSGSAAIAQFSSAWTKVSGLHSNLINTVYFNGDNIYAGTDSFYVSTDKGITWRADHIIKNTPVEVTCFIVIDGILYAGTYGRGVCKSSDNGSTWQEYNSGLSSWGKYCRHFLLNGDTLYSATEGGGVYFTDLQTNSGWIEYNQDLPSNYAWTINSICKLGDDLIISAGASGFYYTRPKGSPGWIERVIDTARTVAPKVFIAKNDTVFAGSRAGIYRSVDHGITFDSVGIRAIPLDVVSFAYHNNRLYAGLTRAGDFFIWYSDDGGNTWVSQDHELTPMSNIYVYDNKLWTITAEGLWYRSVDVTGINDKIEIKDYNLSQNYPNPFNPVTRINYEIPRASNVDLRVYDITGREAAVLVNEYHQPGRYSIDFDAGDLTSGMYMYKLRAAEYTQTRKMLMIK